MNLWRIIKTVTEIYGSSQGEKISQILVYHEIATVDKHGFLGIEEEWIPGFIWIVKKYVFFEEMDDIDM